MADSATDHELLTRYAASNDRTAMEELFRRHAGLVRSVATRELRDEALADDITQAVFLVLMRRASRLTTSVLLSGWLFKAAQFAVADARKVLSRRRAHEREAARMISPADSMDEMATDDETSSQLHAAIGKLSAGDRSVLLMRYFQERSPAELAAVLHISEEAARQRVSRALRRLRQRLAVKGVALSGTALVGTLEASRVPAVPSALISNFAAVLGGASPSGIASSIAQGVLRMIQHAKLLSMTVVSAVVAAALSATIALAAVGRGAPPVAPAAAVRPATSAAPATSTAPALAKHGPARTPKGTLQEAFAAALDGDVDGMIACFNNPSDAEKVPLQYFAAALKGLNAFNKAVEGKFGKEALVQLNQSRLMGGLDPTEIDRANEKVDGATASVDIGESGPRGGIPLIKVGDLWKIDPEVLHSLNLQSVAASARLGPVLEVIAKDIKDGKYPNFAEAAASAQAALRAQLP